MKQRILATAFCLILVVALVGSTGIAAFAANSQTFTGVVSDTMCGAKHVMKGSDAACTKGCVEHGANYALVVGDKVYALEGNKDELGKYAGQSVTVTGATEGNKITVQSVKPSKT